MVSSVYAPSSVYVNPSSVVAGGSGSGAVGRTPTVGADDVAGTGTTGGVGEGAEETGATSIRVS